MNFINRIELQGRVGNVRINSVGETAVANFTMVTEHLYKTRDGAANEVTWIYVVAWQGKDMPDLELINKGASIYVVGRLRTARYISSEGVEKTVFEVIASKIRLLCEESEL